MNIVREALFRGSILILFGFLLELNEEARSK